MRRHPKWHFAVTVFAQQRTSTKSYVHKFSFFLSLRVNMTDVLVSNVQFCLREITLTTCNIVVLYVYWHLCGSLTSTILFVVSMHCHIWAVLMDLITFYEKDILTNFSNQGNKKK